MPITISFLFLALEYSILKPYSNVTYEKLWIPVSLFVQAFNLIIHVLYTCTLYFNY